MRDAKGFESSGHYWFPQKGSKFFVAALLVTGVIVILFGILLTQGVRRPLSAGPLISAHASLDDTCEKCHESRGGGVSDILCRSCHDASGGDHTLTAHVRIGGGDPARAEEFPDETCSTCHREHQGRTSVLSATQDADCARCHFGSFSGHPEFSAILNQVRAPGIAFGHQLHIQEVIKKTGVSREETCFRCHDYSGTDFEPLSFERHCESCHTVEGSLGGVDPVAEEAILSPRAIAARGTPGRWDMEGFEMSRGKISKPMVKHRDEWVIYNVRNLRAWLDPERHRAERAALATRVGELEARLSRTSTMGRRSVAELEARQRTLTSDLTALDARIGAQAAAVEPSRGLSRLVEVAAAAEASGDETTRAEAARLKAMGAMLPPEDSALSEAEFDRRRAELGELLDGIASSSDPALAERAAALKRRLDGVRRGESSRELLVRERERAAAELDKVQRELQMRAAMGTGSLSSVVPIQQVRTLEATLAEARAQLARIPPDPPARAAASREPEREALETLITPCVKCHERNQIPIFQVPAAQPVLTQSDFKHQPHLVQGLECNRCHDTVNRSTSSLEVNFDGINTCRECHRPRQTRTDCRFCHFYHPPEP